VEGIRPDVRVVVNSLLGSDWYMKELRYKVNESDKFDVIFTEDQVAGDRLNYSLYDYSNPIQGYNNKQYYNLDSVFRYYLPSHISNREGREFNILPTVNFKIPVNRSYALASGIAKASDSIVSELQFNYNGNVMPKNDLAMLAIISTTQFKRPVCFTSNQELGKLGIDKYVRLRGMSYELVPFEVQNPINTDAAYENVMKKFAFGNAKNPDVYFDEENRRHLNSLRLSFAQIAEGLIMDGKFAQMTTGNNDLLNTNKSKASQILRKLDSETNEANFPYGMTSNRQNYHNIYSFRFLKACYDADDTVLAKKVSASLLKDLNQQIVYYNSLGEDMNEEKAILNLNYYLFEGNEQIKDPAEIKKINAQSIFNSFDYRSQYPKQIGLLYDWVTALQFKKEVESLANPQKTEPNPAMAAIQKQLQDSINQQKIKDSLAAKSGKKQTSTAKKPN
jgi:hypothetical protein